MTKTEFITAATQQWSVTENEPFFPDIDLMADRALSIHLGTTRWANVSVVDENYLLLIMGSMIHFSRASKSAKLDFPVASQEGGVDKSALYRNNIGMALALKQEYLDSRASTGTGIFVSSIGRYDPIAIQVLPLDVVPEPEAAILTDVHADQFFVYVSWEDLNDDWGYRRTVAYYGTEDPYDPYEVGQIRAGTKAGAYVYDADIEKIKFPVPPIHGDYIVRVARENLNGVVVVSNGFAITIDGTEQVGVVLI